MNSNRKEMSLSSKMQHVWEVISTMQLPASSEQIYTQLGGASSGINRSHFDNMLRTFAVNKQSRIKQNLRNEVERICDGKHVNDKLFELSDGRFTVYQPHLHGIWSIRKSEDGNFIVVDPGVRSSPVDAEIQEFLNSDNKVGDRAWDEDAREWIKQSIARRDGQPAFRRELLKAYESRCVISGCDIEPLLEAAHIMPYKGGHTNHVSNGLLLRADLHKLFDLGMLCVDPLTLQVKLHPDLSGSEYEKYSEQILNSTASPENVPSKVALKYHYENCGSWVSQT